MSSLANSVQRFTPAQECKFEGRVENVRILPVFGAGALTASPRLGHLHITVDDLPWLWADASDNNTVDIAGLPPGEHKVKIELVDANHQVFPGQVVTLAFTVPPR